MDAQRNLGDFFDYGINTCRYSVPFLVKIFLDSGIARLFGEGSPKYVTGKSGCEILWDCLWELRYPLPKEPAAMYKEKSPEYWGGHVLAYYQWSRNITFEKIWERIPMEQIIDTYWPLHEAHINKTMEIMDGWMESANSVR